MTEGQISPSGEVSEVFPQRMDDAFNSSDFIPMNKGISAEAVQKEGALANCFTTEDKVWKDLFLWIFSRIT